MLPSSAYIPISYLPLTSHMLPSSSLLSNMPSYFKYFTMLSFHSFFRICLLTSDILPSSADISSLKYAFLLQICCQAQLIIFISYTFLLQICCQALFQIICCHVKLIFSKFQTCLLNLDMLPCSAYIPYLKNAFLFQICYLAQHIFLISNMPS